MKGGMGSSGPMGGGMNKGGMGGSGPMGGGMSKGGGGGMNKGGMGGSGPMGGGNSMNKGGMGGGGGMKGGMGGSGPMGGGMNKGGMGGGGGMKGMGGNNMNTGGMGSGPNSNGMGSGPMGGDMGNRSRGGGMSPNNMSNGSMAGDNNMSRKGNGPMRSDMPRNNVRNNVYGDSEYGDGPDNDYVRGSSQGSRRLSGDDFRQSRSRSSFVGNQYDFDEYGQLSTDDFAYKSGSRPPVSGSDTRGRGIVDEGRRNVLKNLSDQVPRYARSSTVGNQFDFRQRRPDRLSRTLGYTEDYDEYDDYDRSSQGSYSGRPMVDYIERSPDQYSREIGSFSKPKYSPWGPVGESLIDYQYKNTRSPRGSNYDFYSDSRGSRTSSTYNNSRGPRRNEYDYLIDRNDPRAPRLDENFNDRDIGPRGGRGNYDSGPRGMNNYDSNNGMGGPRGRDDFNSFDGRGGPRGRNNYDSGPRGRDDFDSYGGREGPRGRNYDYVDSYDGRERPRGRNYDSGPRGSGRDDFDSFDTRGGPRGGPRGPNGSQDEYGYSPQNLSRDELQQRRNNLMEYIDDLEDPGYQGRPMNDMYGDDSYY